MDIVSVTESAVRRIREEIVTGRLPPKSRLNEIEMSERFGISRPPLREAFRMLGSEKLVEFVPRKGTFVAPMSIEDGDQVCRTRQMIECTAIDIIGEDGPASLQPLRDALEEARQWPGGPSVMETFSVMSRFHVRLVEAAGNRWLMHCYQSMQSCLARYQVMYLNLPGATAPSLEEHYAVLAYMDGGEYLKAREHLAAHLDRVRQCLRDAMPESAVAPGNSSAAHRRGGRDFAATSPLA